ncbi:SIMPL domain-containing protein [Streptomyces sp. NPDC054766]
MRAREWRGAGHGRARGSAYQDAHTKALQYARPGGHRLGRLVSLTEGGSAASRPVPVAVSVLGQGGSGVPVAPGGIRDSVVLMAVYEPDRGGAQRSAGAPRPAAVPGLV